MRDKICLLNIYTGQNMFIKNIYTGQNMLYTGQNNIYRTKYVY
jgi:hypothetical protein